MEIRLRPATDPNPNGYKKDVGVLTLAHPNLRPWLPSTEISKAASPRRR